MICYRKSIILGLIASVSSITASGQKAMFTIENPSASERRDELVILSRAFIEARIGKTPASASPEWGVWAGEYYVQLDDLNGDGKWDEGAFLTNLGPKEKQSISLKFDRAAVVTAETRAHVRHRRKAGETNFGPQLIKDQVPAGQPNTDFSKAKLPPFLTEGPAWENDKVGFRIYMDIRNTKDIWGKTTTAMMMDTVGTDPSKSYHNLAGWGMDLLAVGKSLGAGSLALNVSRPGKTDTVVRLGGLNMGEIKYEQVADGPNRAIFRLHYPAWNVLGDGKLTQLTEEISIWGGQYFYESKITIHNAPAGSVLLTGIVNLKSKIAETINAGKMGVLWTYDQQSENKDGMGMAILGYSDQIATMGENTGTAGEVKNTYLVKFNNNKAVKFRYYAGWTLSSEIFSTSTSFTTYLKKQAQAASEPVIVK